MILLVHSCEGREWLREHWERYFDKSGWYTQYVWMTGPEMFSDRLIEELYHVTDEYIWYTLDDYFIVEPIDWAYYESLAEHLHADVLRVQPNVQVDSLPYRFEPHGELLKQTKDSAYIMSMQTSIWRREYFLKCLVPGMDPWEVEGSKPELGNVYFVPRLPFWYIDTVRRGEISEKHKWMFND